MTDSMDMEHVTGHITACRIGAQFEFDITTKKGKTKTFSVNATQPFAAQLLDAVTHSYWAERKVTALAQANGSGNRLAAIHIGSQPKPAKEKKPPKPEPKIVVEEASARQDAKAG